MDMGRLAMPSSFQNGPLLCVRTTDEQQTITAERLGAHRPAADKRRTVGVLVMIKAS